MDIIGADVCLVVLGIVVIVPITWQMWKMLRAPQTREACKECGFVFVDQEPSFQPGYCAHHKQIAWQRKTAVAFSEQHPQLVYEFIKDNRKKNDQA